MTSYAKQQIVGLSIIGVAILWHIISRICKFEQFGILWGISLQITVYGIFILLPMDKKLHQFLLYFFSAGAAHLVQRTSAVTVLQFIEAIIIILSLSQLLAMFTDCSRKNTALQVSRKLL